MKPEISTGHFSQFQARIYQVCLFVLIPAIFISFIQPAEGIECYCLDKDNKDTCKGKLKTGCDEEDKYCWFTMIDGYLEQAGCGTHKEYSSPNCLNTVKQNVSVGYCNCGRDCCNAGYADYWKQCDHIAKDLTESLARPSKTAAAPTTKPAAKNGKGIKCFCYDKANKTACKGKNVVTCDKGVDACWHTVDLVEGNSLYRGGGCGKNWANPSISCYNDEGAIDYCSCDKDCCNAPDVKPGNCNAVPKIITKTIDYNKKWAPFEAAASVHGKAEEAFKKAEGESAKKAAEAALKKAKVAMDKQYHIARKALGLE